MDYLIEIYIQSPFQIFKRVESFFVKNSRAQKLIIKQHNSYISDLRNLFELYHTSVRLGFYVPENTNYYDIKSLFTYLLVDTGIVFLYI